MLSASVPRPDICFYALCRLDTGSSNPESRNQCIVLLPSTFQSVELFMRTVRKSGAKLSLAVFPMVVVVTVVIMVWSPSSAAERNDVKTTCLNLSVATTSHSRVVKVHRQRTT